jgi:hypothetical protein
MNTLNSVHVTCARDGLALLGKGPGTSALALPYYLIK